MLYCYWCGSWFYLNEVPGEGKGRVLCLDCKGGYLFFIDIEMEDDIELSMEEFLGCRS